MAFALLLTLLWQGTAYAEVRGGWNGFISQGWVLSDHNGFYGDSDGTRGSFDYRELGLNGFLEVTPQLKLNAQILSRVAGKSSDGDPVIDYMFADWSLLQRPDQQAGVRIGRNKNAFGLFNETRDIAFTRPGIIMPQSIYFDQLRELLLSSDGLGFYYRKAAAYGNWLVDAQYGQLQAEEPTESIFMGGSKTGGFSDSRAAVGRLLFEPRGGRWRLGFTGINANFPFSPGPGDHPLYTEGDVGIWLAILSAQYNLELWSFTVEAARGETHWKELGPLVPDRSTLEGIYLQVDHRLSTQWQLTLRYDYQALSPTTSSGENFNALYGLPGHIGYAKDLTAGLRYQPNSRWDLSTELHHINGTVWLSREENPNPAELKQHWNLLMFQAAYRF